ncbi:unnamed protein product [Brachionus calyciflorus]|uniref:Uncharacterized protein n=1 Tax=Brachionus calyciflorus TaxID=104777 RepID=A0A813M5U7_9BILA|nr:unnamed protein product [Brachionus calyciflorus]
MKNIVFILSAIFCLIQSAFCYFQSGFNQPPGPAPGIALAPVAPIPHPVPVVMPVLQFDRQKPKKNDRPRHHLLRIKFKIIFLSLD